MLCYFLPLKHVSSSLVGWILSLKMLGEFQKLMIAMLDILKTGGVINISWANYYFWFPFQVAVWQLWRKLGLDPCCSLLIHCSSCLNKSSKRRVIVVPHLMFVLMSRGLKEDYGSRLWLCTPDKRGVWLFVCLWSVLFVISVGRQIFTWNVKMLSHFKVFTLNAVLGW